MRLSIIPYKTVIPTKHQPEYQASDSSSIVDVQDWLIALFGVVGGVLISKSRKFSNFCLYIKQMIIYEQIFFGCEKKIPCFFVYFSVSSFEKKIGFLHLQVAKSSTTWLIEVLLQTASWPSLPSERSRRTRSDLPPRMADGEETF